MRNSAFWWLFIAFMLLLDFYFFQAIRLVCHSSSQRTRSVIFITYWVLSATAIILLLILPYLHFQNQSKFIRTTVFAVIAGLFFAKLIASVFLLIDDVRRGIQWVVGKVFFSNTEGETIQQGEGISRSVFLSWIGIAAGTGLFGSLLYGFSNKYNYKVRRLNLAFNNLPVAFKGLKIVQISDIHCGSFHDKKAVIRGVDKIMRENADLIFFTGDLVNDRADEMREYLDVFSRVSAPLGVFSILGNHDYGDYVRWDTKENKIANLNELKNIHHALGWKLLMNEHVILDKAGENIAVIGVENWSSKARFPKYGDMKKAYAGCESSPFKILLSHDPSHWKGEVLSQYPDIDLTLSGHTHGMQFGVEMPGFKWSPVQYIYDEWAGLYEKAAQKLYVNRGYGFLGYPGRVGILPEITVFKLI
jgi:uncharacterized protein